MKFARTVSVKDVAATTSEATKAASSFIKQLGLGREQITLLYETLGIIVALSLATACNADEKIKFDDLIQCDGWQKFRSPIVICFHFGLAQLIVFIITLLSIGYVKDDQWHSFQTFALMPSMVANVGVFIFIHEELSRIMDVNAWCQKKNAINELTGNTPSDAELLARARDAETSIFTFWGYVAWLVYVPLTCVWMTGYVTHLSRQKQLAKKAARQEDVFLDADEAPEA
tara:strand:- start:9644 stop:10330 length:687 start_codon:yes stop_codon:yes gene_type:complete